MTSLSRSLYRATQVRDLDRLSIEEYAIPGLCLMERAGASAFNYLQQRWPERKRLIVLCGIGNNAGDGYVIARLALIAGYQVDVLQLGDSQRLRGDAKQSLEHWLAVGGQIKPFRNAALSTANIAVDALFGTGLDRPVEGVWAEAIAALNEQHYPLLAVDIPSGLHADSGAVLGIAVKADATPTFIGLKQGLFTGSGPEYCGEILFSDLGVPAEVYQHCPPAALRWDAESLRAAFPSRPRDAHKGNFGHVLIIGGEQGYTGAAQLAAAAALRSGAGKVSLATRRAHAAWMNLNHPELMCHGVESAAELAPLLAQADSVAIGPGLGQGAWGEMMLAAAISSGKPSVVDADALNLLARNPQAWPQAIITPHPGEAARLLHCRSRDVQADRFAAAQALAELTQSICVLKGAGTLIVEGDGPPALCSAGNPGMACGGMGDLLSGIIASLVGQGYAPAEAARLGVCLHAAAGDAAARLQGERGLLPSDLLPQLGLFLNPRKQDDDASL